MDFPTNRMSAARLFFLWLLARVVVVLLLVLLGLWLLFCRNFRKSSFLELDNMVVVDVLLNWGKGLVVVVVVVILAFIIVEKILSLV